MNKWKDFLTKKGHTEEAFAALEPSEMAKLNAEFQNELSKEIQDQITSKTSKEDVSQMVADAIKGIKPSVTEDAFKELEERLVKQGQTIQAMKASGNANESFTSQLAKNLTDNAEQLKALKNDRSQGVSFQIKAVGTMTTATNTTGQIPQAERESGITRIQRRNPFMLDLVNTGSINSTTWEWVEQEGVEGEPAMTAEGAKKAQIDFDLVVNDAKVVKVTAFIKVTKEMLDDIDLMRSEIDQELTERINLLIDRQILSGDGTGQNLVGIEANATPFAAGTFADTISEPNNGDVLKVALNQVMINEFDANTIIMHPSDVTAMELEKASDGHYIMPPFRNAEGTMVSGVRVVSNTGVDQDDFLAGDFSKAGIRFKEGLNIDVGYENDDFTKNLVTILAEARLVQRVKSNHYGAFVKGTFTAAKALLDSAV
jgi:HK97 family phage major capsid protein